MLKALRLLIESFSMLSFKLISILTVARFAIVMTLLAPKLGFKETFGTLRVTFASCKFPSWWTFHALIPTRATTCITAQITFDATAAVAVVTGNDNENENVNFVAELPSVHV